VSATVIHSAWFQRHSSPPLRLKPEDIVDTACGISVPWKRATDQSFKVTCKRCRRSRNG